MSSTSDHDPVTRITPGGDAFTLDEVRDHVRDLRAEFAGQPGVELLGLVAAMLKQTRCTCQPVDSGHRATVTPLRPQQP